MASDQTTGHEGELVQNWRQWLQSGSNWEGAATIFASSSPKEILDFTFEDVAPILPNTERRLVDIAFSYLKNIWKSTRFLEADSDMIREIIQLRLDWNLKRNGFQSFEVQLGTEVNEDSSLFWLFHTNQTDYEAMFGVKYVQVNSILGDNFIGYRIWKLKYPWGDALALAAMKQPGLKVHNEEC